MFFALNRCFSLEVKKKNIFLNKNNNDYLIELTILSLKLN